MDKLSFKQLFGRYKALPQRTKNIVFLILGLAIFILAYYFGYQPMVEKTAEIQTQVDAQAAYVSELKGYYDNMNFYEKNIEESKDTINADLMRLPRDIKDEDFLMYIKVMNEELGGYLQSVNFDEVSFISEFSCVADDKTVTAESMRAGASFTSYMTYAQLKDMLDYIYEKTTQITFVDSVSVTYYSENALLESNVDLSKYYITYDGAEYVPVPVPDVELRVSDPFHTS